MERVGIIALTIALGSGVAVGVQSTLNNWSSRIAGPISTGLLVNFAGGIISGLILLVLLLTGQMVPAATLSKTGLLVIIAGAIGIGIVGGIAFSLPRIGIAAGLAAVILGQLLVATIVDTMGWGGAGPIPLSISRIAGLVLLLLATFLLLQRR